jgi:hypothetical protein
VYDQALKIKLPKSSWIFNNKVTRVNGENEVSDAFGPVIYIYISKIVELPRSFVELK